MLFLLHGKMIDKPIIERAQRVIELARVTGQLAKIEDEYNEIKNKKFFNHLI